MAELKLVPAEATPEMIHRATLGAVRENGGLELNIAAMYREMVKFAPAVPDAGGWIALPPTRQLIIVKGPRIAAPGEFATQGMLERTHWAVNGFPAGSTRADDWATHWKPRP